MLNQLLAVDARLFTLINGAHNGMCDGFFSAVTWLGNGWILVPLFALLSFLKASRRTLGGVLLSGAVSFAGGGLLVSAIKVLVHRHRPFSSSLLLVAPGLPVHTVGKVLLDFSFPSGHSQTAFTLAALLAFFFGRWYWFSFVPAFLVAYSRVYLGVHFPLDTIAGALLGTGVVWTVLAVRKLAHLPEEKGSAQRSCT